MYEFVRPLESGELIGGIPVTNDRKNLWWIRMASFPNTPMIPVCTDELGPLPEIPAGLSGLNFKT
jgi:hypothetical protein